MANRDIYDRNKHPADVDKTPKQVPLQNPTGQHLDDKTNYYQPPLETPGRAPIGILSLFDPDNPDRRLFDEVEIEIITLSAPPTKLYRIDFDRTDIDDTHGEAQFKYFMEPITIYGSYEDISFESTLTRFGIDEHQEIDMVLNYTDLLRDCGGQLNEGDMLQTYDGRLWQVISSIVQNEPLWRFQHNHIHCKRVDGEGCRIPDPSRPGKYVDISDSPNRDSETGRDTPANERQMKIDEKAAIEKQERETALSRVDDY